MATLLRPINFQAPPPSFSTTHFGKSIKSSPFCVNFRNNTNYCFYSHNLGPKFGSVPPKFIIFGSSEDVIETQTEELPKQAEIQDNTDGAVNGETSEDSSSDDGKPDVDESPASPVLTALQSYKEALDNNDEAKIAEVEAFFKSIEDEKNALEKKVLSLSEDFSVERERVLRISADFDNFRKRTERERLSLVSNAQGEVIEFFLPVVDNFERAKSQIKVETEAEEKISNSYQSIYKQFFEIISSIGVVPVETVGKAFDPMLHEAIMREESTEYAEDIIIEECRKGFKLGDRLLRPSMVKVSAGPGPGKPEPSAESSVEEEGATEISEAANDEGDSGEPTAV